MNAYFEQEEKKQLKITKQKLHTALNQIDKNVKAYANELQESKEYLWENKAGMDHAEKVSVRQSVTQSALTGEAAVAKKNRIRKLLSSPYFGRIDFGEKPEAPSFPVYIGVHSFLDEEENSNLIHDWRAPISGMFYDFELGPAHFEAPTGKVEGNILLKRQFRIKNGEMEFMLESAMNIHDDVLQQELSRASDEKMKNIVATIQRDQNAIIRNEDSRVLIIQGVAGSGKTSIALHRIAFLLYRFKETITSKDILIVSPNKVFSDYISNVLPELGEEKIPEMGIENLAETALENKFRFQTFFEQVSKLLENKNENFVERIRYKSSFVFLGKLNEYLSYIENHYFQATDLLVKRYPVPAWFIDERFRAYYRVPMFKRFNKVAEDVEENLKLYYQYDINGKERNGIRSSVKKMFRITNLRNLYKDFYNWVERPEMYKQGPKSTLEYADVFPLVYLKIRLEGIMNYNHVKHLLVDEMQDYTPVQYEVISRLFACKKTILGDANQSVNPYSSSNAAEIKKVFPGADAVKLLKSYRSTFEITRFAQRLSQNMEVEAMERHGSAPLIHQLNDPQEEIQKIYQLIREFDLSDYNTLGIICKTQARSEALFEELNAAIKNVLLLSQESTVFGNGIIITAAHFAKGLEFDQVIVPHVSEKNYVNEIDKNMLYIACTRSMHRLDLTCVKQLTSYLR